MFIVDQFFAAVCSRKRSASAFSMPQCSAEQRVGQTNIKDRMIAVGKYINPEAVIACHDLKIVRDVSTSVDMTRNDAPYEWESKRKW
jgi:hypothetical protein